MQKVVIHKESKTRYAVSQGRIRNLQTKADIPASSTMGKRLIRFVRDTPTKELLQRFELEGKGNK